MQHLGEAARKREVAVVDRIEGAAQQADPAGQGSGLSVRLQVKVLCRDGAGRSGARLAASGRGG
jgi:hypothetical protein